MLWAAWHLGILGTPLVEKEEYNTKKKDEGRKEAEPKKEGKQAHRQGFPSLGNAGDRREGRPRV